MRRFFRVHRNEDFSQIQYLTAKCNRLSQENAVLERECMVAREGERALQVENEGLGLQLRQKEQAILELRVTHDQLINQLNQEQELVEILKQRVRCMAEESCKEAALLGMQLEQVGSELQLLLASEARLEGLLEDQREHARRTHAQLSSLKTQLHRTRELEELQAEHAAVTQELEETHSAHQRTVEELRRENEGSLKKLRETAEQFEWLCEQQRVWMCGFKRFKDNLSEEKEALVHQVDRLQKKVTDLRKNVNPSTQDAEDVDIPRCNSSFPSPTSCRRGRAPWDADVLSGLQAEVDRWRGMYHDLFSRLAPAQGEDAVDGYQKPP